MKKYIVITLALILSTGALCAQKQNKKTKSTEKSEVYSPETRAAMRADRLAQQIELTEKEKENVIKLFTKEETERKNQRAAMEAKREASREANKLSREEMMTQMKAEQEKSDTQLEMIIGAEKMAKVKEQRKTETDGRPEGRQQGGPVGKGSKGSGTR